MSEHSTIANNTPIMEPVNAAYGSKVDLWLICLILVLLGLILAPVLLFAFSWIAVVLSIILLVFTFYILFSIKYVVNDSTLNIKCGFLPSEKVDIKHITKITPTKSILSAAAASLDRIALHLSKQRTAVIISPKNQKDFIDKLKSINSNIEISL